MPPKTVTPSLPEGWFDNLPDAALLREYRLLRNPENLSPLIEVSAETFRRWGLQGIAPKPVVIGATRHYRVGEIRRWLRGDWKSEAP